MMIGVGCGFFVASAAQAEDPTDAPETPPATAPTTAPTPPAKKPAEPATPLTPTPTKPLLPPPPADTTTLEQHRSPVQALNEHFLGSASRPIRFDWRRSPVELGALGSEVIERNNFGVYRVGGLARRALDDVMLELAIGYSWTVETTSSQTLALTPFRQYGRPSHWELDFNVGYAITEGVVTPLASFIPPAEMVLVAYGGFRYVFYPETLRDRKIQDIGLDLISPQLSAAERERVEPVAPGGMLVDSARYHIMAGLGVSVYFQPGFFVTPRAMLGIPVLAPVTGTGLGFFWEMGLGLGYAL